MSDVVGRLAMIGVTHRAAPLSLLERVALCAGARTKVLTTLQESGCGEAVVLSTCSRTEIYSHALAGGTAPLLSALAAHTGTSRAVIEAVAEARTGQPVAEHLFRVTSGLDSRILGEHDIHGQVRAPFRHADAAGMSGPTLGRLFPAALKCSTRVRAETSIGQQPQSLGHRSVDVGLATFATGTDPAVLIIGSGRMASAAAEHLARSGRRATMAARNRDAAVRLVGADRWIALDDLDGALRSTDLVIVATSAPAPVVTLPHIRRAMFGRTRPITLVDLSVPRNIDPAVAAVSGVALVGLEDLTDVVDAGTPLAATTLAARELCRAEVNRYVDEQAARNAGPLIASIRALVEHTCTTELTRLSTGRRTEAADISRVAHAVAGKLLHRPTVLARSAAASGNAEMLALLRDIFEVPVDADRYV